MKREEIDDLIGIDGCDAEIDEWAADLSGGPFDPPKTITLTISSYDHCQALIDLAAQANVVHKREFQAAVAGERSSEASTAALQVLSLREMLQQLFPMREAELSTRRC